MKRAINIGILLLLALFITFRINVALNELRNDRMDIEHPLEIPAMFNGMLPCASCPAIDYTLTLMEDGYQETNLFIDQEPDIILIEGTWEFSSDTLLIYNDEGLIHKRFLLNGDEIILLDMEGGKIKSLSSISEKLPQ